MYPEIAVRIKRTRSLEIEYQNSFAGDSLSLASNGWLVGR
jgi:hypothetical protein